MTRKFHVLDRLACLLVGALLILGALVVVDWKYRLLFDAYPETPILGPVPGWTTTAWWPWAVGALGLVLILLGLWWLLSHLPRPGRSVVRLLGSDQTGRLEVDLTSLAEAVGRTFESSSPVNNVSTTTDESGADRLADRLMVVHASVDPRADGPSLTQAARRITEEVNAAFPRDRVHSRILLQAPQPPSRLRQRRRTPRVQ